MKRQNLRTVSLIVVTFTYLLIGAAIFGYLESEHEVRQREQVDWMEKRVRWKYNISEDDYTVLTTAIIKSVPHKAGIQWKFPGAFYFATTVVTTIGYGHSTPSTLAGRSFCMVYALIGIPLGLVMFQSIGERLNTFVRVALRSVKRCLKTKNPEVTQTNLVMVVLVLSTILMTSMAAIFAKYERWEYFDALYYCFITLTTIGFGDYVALQKESALQSKPEYVMLSLVFILFGLSVVSSAVNLLVLKFLTLNTEDERRDEQIRSTAALDPYELKGVEITMNATKQHLRSKLQANPTKAGRLHSGSSSDNNERYDDGDEEEADEQPDEEDDGDELGRMVANKRASLRPLSHAFRDKRRAGHGELPDGPDLKCYDPDGFHESPNDRVQLHERLHNWCAFCHKLDEPAPASSRLHRLDLLAERAGHCCSRHELAVCQVAHSNSYQLGACHQQRLGSSSNRRRPVASRSQHSFSGQCDEQKPLGGKQRTRPATSAEEEDDSTTASSKKLLPLDLGGSRGRVASSGQRSSDQLAPVAPAGRLHTMSSACNHCDRHSPYLRAQPKPQVQTNVMGANPYYHHHDHHHRHLQNNGANTLPLGSLSSVHIRPFSDSNDGSNQSIARGTPKGAASRLRSPFVSEQQRYNESSLRQRRRHSNSCSCSNDSLQQRQLQSPATGRLRGAQRPPALCDAFPTSSSPHLLLNPSRLQEQQLGGDHLHEVQSSWNQSPPFEQDAEDIDDGSIALASPADVYHCSSVALAGHQSSWVGIPQTKRDKLRSSALSLGANQSGERNANAHRTLDNPDESCSGRGKANVLRNRSANELERATPDAASSQIQVAKLLCKCCCEHDECVKYALDQAASSEAIIADELHVKVNDNAENSSNQQGQTASSSNNEGPTVTELK